MDIIPQIIGFIAVITFLLSYQQKKRNNIILFNTISRCLYILQYILLGAFSGAILDILGAISSVVAGQKDKPFILRNLKLLLVLINFIIVISGMIIALVNNSLLDLLPVAGVLLHTSAFWISDEKIIRRVSLLGSPFWFVYNFLSHAYGSAIGDILTIISIIIAIIKYKNSSEICENDIKICNQNKRCHSKSKKFFE